MHALMAASTKIIVTPTGLLLSVLRIIFCSSFFFFLCSCQLQESFYSSSCPDAENVVSFVVRSAVSSDPTFAAALLRLHFHDCFAQGCDGSILIEGSRAEKTSSNHAGLRGFNVVETAKTQLERICPGIVSCADILAMVARDSVALSGGPSYRIETGRLDGRVSDVSDADDMPEVDDPISMLRAKFADRGLSDADLVLLSAGGHTIGTTACFFMKRRLYDFSPAGGRPDPSINPSFLVQLQRKCPPNGNVNIRLPLDRGSDLRFDDNILHNIRDGFAALASDAQLYQDLSTRSIIDSYLGVFRHIFFGPSFEDDFAASMVKMGRLGVLDGSGQGNQGEIRHICSRFNN